MYRKMLIMNWTYRIGLPLRVRSTSLQLSDKLEAFFNTLSTFNSPFEKLCFEAATCIFLGCKFEDVHGHLEKLLEKINGYSGFKHFDLIIEKEIEILEFLSFNFDFVNLYQAAYATSLIAGNEKRKNIDIEQKQTEGINKKGETSNMNVSENEDKQTQESNLAKSKWESLLNRINLSLMVTDLNRHKKEAIIAALPSKLEVIGGDEEVVRDIRNRVKGFVFYNETQIKEKLECLN